LLVAVVSAAIWLVMQCQSIETGVITYILITYLIRLSKYQVSAQSF